MQFTVSVDGVEQFASRLTSLRAATQDLSEPLEDIGALTMQEFKANFDAEGGVLGYPWEPRKKEYPWPILQKSGNMKNLWDVTVEPQEVEIKNAMDYATYHHFGTATLPSRPLVGITDNIIKIANNFLKTYLLSKF